MSLELASDRLVAPSQSVAVRRFQSLATLEREELLFLRELTAQKESVRVGTELVADGETSPRPRLILSGWACRQRVLRDGRRQIFGFLLPGDLVGGATGPLASAACVALTPLTLCEAAPLAEVAARPSARYGGLAQALAKARELEAVSLLDHVVRLGRQSAYERLAHLFLELRERLSGSGRPETEWFAMPLTQEVLADTLGLSIVHVNRTLQQMKRERLIETRQGAVRLLQPTVLASIADYRSPRG